MQVKNQILDHGRYNSFETDLCVNMKQECLSVIKSYSKRPIQKTNNISYTVRFGLGFLATDYMSFLQVQTLKAKT